MTSRVFTLFRNLHAVILFPIDQDDWGVDLWFKKHIIFYCVCQS